MIATNQTTFDDALQENNVHQLSEQQPSVVFQRKFLKETETISTRSDRLGWTHIERVILAHLTGKLGTNPVSHGWFAILIKPSQSLNLSNDPLFLALFREHPTQTSIVRGAPKREIE